MDTNEMDTNYAFVRKEFVKLLNLYRNKYILVTKQAVAGSFDTFGMAAEEGVKTYGIKGSFLVYFMSETEPVNFIAPLVL